MTPVGVLPLARDFNSRISADSQGSPACRLYFGWAFLGPFFPMGDPGLFHAAVAMVMLLSHRPMKQRWDQVCPSLRKRPASCMSRAEKMPAAGRTSLVALLTSSHRSKPRSSSTEDRSRTGHECQDHSAAAGPCDIFLCACYSSISATLGFGRGQASAC